MVYILWCTGLCPPPGQGEIGMGKTHFTPQKVEILEVVIINSYKNFNLRF
jgi:hypothetical protein